MSKINFQEAIVYEIHPQSFNDANGDGIGDLQGIIAKLDYLSLLGVNYLWLNPIYLSPQNDNGYDVANYQEINPIFGTMTDFKNLIAQAKKRNIFIMMDMIFNHCSTNHQWFKNALKGDPNYLKRFFFVKSKPGQLPTNWTSKFGGSTWEYSQKLKMYYLHLFDKTQADLNWEDNDLCQDIYNIINFWIKIGVKGLRFDVINLIGKPQQFIDDHSGDGRKCYTDANKVHEYIKALAANTFNKYDDVITVGELSSTTINHTIQYTNPNNKQLDMAFTFHHLKIDYLNNQKWALESYQPAKLVAILKQWQIAIQDGNGWVANFLNNHDQPRALSRFGDPINYRFQSASSLAATVLFLRGTPFIYQGEEFGMENNNFTSLKQFRDVESKNYYLILNQQSKSKNEIFKILNARSRDHARTPMQWDSTPYAGFSNNKPWIDVNSNYQEINYQNDVTNKNSIFKAYQQLIKLRQAYKSLIYGTINFININDNVLSFTRNYENEEILVIINLSNQKIDFNKNMMGTTILYNNYFAINNYLESYQVIVTKQK